MSGAKTSTQPSLTSQGGPLRRRAILPLALVAALGFAFSANSEPRQLSPPTAASRSPSDGDVALESALKQLASEDARVAAVAYRLAVANVELCGSTAPQLGMVVQSVRQYSSRLRSAVRLTFNIDDRPAVLTVVPDGPAAGAGLMPNDILLAVNGQPVTARAANEAGFDDDAPQSYQDVERTRSMLEAALRLGPAQVEVQRGTVALKVTLNPVSGCAYDTQLIPSDELNASADGRHVFINTGFVNYATSDNDLALILGHELAHDVLHHREQLDRQGFARSLIGNLGSSRQSLISVEQQADYVGLYLTARAGYDISGAGAFWRRLAHDHGDPWYDHWGHPSALARARALDATRDEIAAKTKAGKALIPSAQGDDGSAGSVTTAPRYPANAS